MRQKIAAALYLLLALGVVLIDKPDWYNGERVVVPLGLGFGLFCCKKMAVQLGTGCAFVLWVISLTDSVMSVLGRVKLDSEQLNWVSTLAIFGLAECWLLWPVFRKYSDGDTT